jgi:hypothetical protein
MTNYYDLKECFVQKKFSDDAEKDNLNYDITMKRTEFKDLILALNIIIEDLKNNQNKRYIINEVENVISKLKKADTPPKKEINFNLIQTFSTVDLKEPNNNNTCDNNKNNNCNNNCNDLSPCADDESLIDCKTYSTDVISNNNSNKEKYEGPIINGKKEGRGVYIYQNGSKYEGCFKNDKREGNGIFYYANGDRYKGTFHDGYYEGTGVFYFNNGDRYEGEFYRNKFKGKGKYYYHNGDRFEGQWLNDKKNGEGIYIYLNGDRITGYYYEGKPSGAHVKYSINGRVSQINYSKS